MIHYLVHGLVPQVVVPGEEQMRLHQLAAAAALVLVLVAMVTIQASRLPPVVHRIWVAAAVGRVILLHLLMHMLRLLILFHVQAAEMVLGTDLVV